MFRLMLNAHPMLVAPPECGFVEWNFQRYENAAFSDGSVIDAFVASVLASKKMETWGLSESRLKFHLQEAALQNPALTYEDASKVVFQTYAEKLGKEMPKVALDKNNYYLQRLSILERATPNARFIHLVRDVRDVACSYLALTQSNYDSPYAPRLETEVGAIAKAWKENNETLLDFLEGKDAIRVRYEDLVLHPREELGRIADLLGVGYHDAMERYYEFNDEPLTTVAWKQKTFEPVDKDRIGQYKTTLTEAELAVVWDIAGGVMEQLGYHQ